MRKAAIALAVSVGIIGTTNIASAQDRPGFRDTPKLPGGDWRVHDADRPEPKIVAPGSTPGAPPSDAIVLFDGTSLDQWQSSGAPWLLNDGAMTVPKGTGRSESSLVSRQSFGDVQLHLEFRSPSPVQGTSQDRGNSGIWFMQRYEVQILDGHQNSTYADGTVGALYGWKPPLVNPSRPPGEWQSYDIIFERPRFRADGSLLRPAYVTAFLNGVLVQNHQAVLGETIWRNVARYTAHPDAAPIQLQDHASPVSFRNIWVRPLSSDATSHDLPGE